MFTVYRNEILKAHSASGLLHKAVNHSSADSLSHPAFTDYFYSPEKKKKCLVHLSGVHGVEGYLGSLIQRQILSQDQSDLPFQLIVVHAVNPIGMSQMQRTNPANVDLNRNSLENYRIENPNYQRFLPLLKSGHLFEFLKVLPLIAKLGIAETVKTVACGQTDFPEAPFFAGHELQPELTSLLENLKALTAPDAHLHVLDVHTGLGRFAQETLILDGFGPSDEREYFERVLKSPTVCAGQTPGVYRADGTLTLLLKRHWKSFHVFQEFGTYPTLKVLNALIHRRPEKMLEAFFPESELWRTRCQDIGLLRFRQMVEDLS